MNREYTKAGIKGHEIKLEDRRITETKRCGQCGKEMLPTQSGKFWFCINCNNIEKKPLLQQSGFMTGRKMPTRIFGRRIA